jgi:hypothetical protein
LSLTLLVQNLASGLVPHKRKSNLFLAGCTSVFSIQPTTEATNQHHDATWPER